MKEKPNHITEPYKQTGDDGVVTVCLKAVDVLDERLIGLQLAMEKLREATVDDGSRRYAQGVIDGICLALCDIGEWQTHLIMVIGEHDELRSMTSYGMNRTVTTSEEP